MTIPGSVDHAGVDYGELALIQSFYRGCVPSLVVTLGCSHIKDLSLHPNTPSARACGSTVWIKGAKCRPSSLPIVRALHVDALTALMTSDAWIVSIEAEIFALLQCLRRPKESVVVLVGYYCILYII